MHFCLITWWSLSSSMASPNWLYPNFPCMEGLQPFWIKAHLDSVCSTLTNIFEGPIYNKFTTTGLGLGLGHVFMRDVIQSSTFYYLRTSCPWLVSENNIHLPAPSPNSSCLACYYKKDQFLGKFHTKVFQPLLQHMVQRKALKWLIYIIYTGWDVTWIKTFEHIQRIWEVFASSLSPSLLWSELSGHHKTISLWFSWAYTGEPTVY